MNFTRVRHSLVWILIALSITAFETGYAQEKGAVQYLSPVDDQLTVYRLCFFKATDNARGIYAKPLQEALSELVENDARFKRESCTGGGAEFAPPEILAADPQNAKKKFEGSTAQAALHLGAYVKNETITLRLYLFLKSDGTAIVQEVQENINTLDLVSLVDEVEKLYARAIRALPYDGLVISRTQNRVTLNVGSAQGASAGQALKVIRIIRAERHPRFQFLLKTDQVLIGSIRLTKVDPQLSFGEIEAESAPEAVTTSSKITGLRDLSSAANSATPATVSPLVKRGDVNVAFGDHPEEWIPENPPTFGMIGAQLGLGFFQEKTNIPGIGSIGSKSTPYPRLTVSGEAWLTSRLIAKVRVVQGIVTLKNPRAGSTPGHLNAAVSKYELSAGYRHTFTQDFFGPHLFALAGISSSRFSIDESSAFTTTHFRSLYLHLGGEFPIAPEEPWTVGADVRLHLWPSMTESPVSSGADSSNQVTEFTVMGAYKLTHRLRLKTSLDFALYSAALKGTGTRGERATSISVRDNAINFGLDYFF